jgi:hypothetical protein
MIHGISKIFVETKKIQPEDSPSSIDPYSAGQKLAGVWYKIWGGSIPDGYGAVGEGYYCKACSGTKGFPRFDEPALPHSVLEEEIRKAGIEKVRDSLTREQLGTICDQPDAHRDHIDDFWSPDRGGSYVVTAINAVNDSGEHNYSVLSFDRSGQVISWCILYEINKELIISAIKEDIKVTISNTPLYFDTIGVDTSRRDWWFRNLLGPMAMVQQMKYILTALHDCSSKGSHLVFRTDPKSGKHVLDFAKEFYDEVVQIGESAAKPGRFYYRAIGFKLSPGYIQKMRKLPGGIAYLNSIGIGDFTKMSEEEAKLYLEEVKKEDVKIKSERKWVKKALKEIGFRLTYGGTGSFAREIVLKGLEINDTEEEKARAIRMLIEFDKTLSQRQREAFTDNAVVTALWASYPLQVGIMGLIAYAHSPLTAALYAAYEAIPGLGGISGLLRSAYLTFRAVYYSLRHGDDFSKKVGLGLASIVDFGYVLTPLISMPKPKQEVINYIKEIKAEKKKAKGSMLKKIFRRFVNKAKIKSRDTNFH